MLPPPFLAMDPADDLAWLAVADWLEENGEPERAELVRLTQLLRHDPASPETSARDIRRMELLAAGVEPCVATMTNSIGMTFAWIPPGTFRMGSPEGVGEDNEHPEHEVQITTPFYLGVYEVTQKQFKAVMGYNPSYFSRSGKGRPDANYPAYSDPAGGKDDLEAHENASEFPVENVSWDEASEFCEKLSALATEKEKTHLYRLPTEAEWEYACRGGAGSRHHSHFGQTLSSTKPNFGGSNLGRPCAVGSYEPNGFGLYYMHGNVYEWCADWYGENYYADSPVSDPLGSFEGSERVVRGGYWNNSAEDCSAGYRYSLDPAVRSNYLGLRLLRNSARGQ